MKKSNIALIIFAALIGIIIFLGIIGFLYYKANYNNMMNRKVTVEQQWSNVENVYQRRADLIPNLVNTVKGYADFEKETLTRVIEARARATSVNIDANNLDANTFSQFQQAQDGLSSALSRLMVVVERYPDLKANQNFLELQAQLEGTENRIAVERMRYNDAVGNYNRYIKMFPRNIIFKFPELPFFEAQEGTEVAPAVEF
ncbi:MAG: LemA family protein [Bacteroidales bacterium]|jgi:LemA protein|nr:LemA family protein [Bacteroidales bacterium]